MYVLWVIPHDKVTQCYPTDFVIQDKNLFGLTTITLFIEYINNNKKLTFICFRIASADFFVVGMKHGIGIGTGIGIGYGCGTAYIAIGVGT